MHTNLLILALAFGVSTAGAFDTSVSPAGAGAFGCFARYRACQEALQNVGYVQTLDGFCSKATTVAKCFADASKACNDGNQETFNDLETLVDDVCSPNATLIEDLETELECVTTNIQTFRTCSLAEEQPNNLGELCGIFDVYFKCHNEKAKEVCSSATAIERLMKPFTKLLTSCSSERGVTFDYCTKHYIKCGLKTLDKGYELECMDLQELGECVLEVSCSPPGEIMTPVLQSYVKQIPDYCNSESPFRKNFDKSYQCFFPTFRSVSDTCAQIMRAEAVELANSGITDAKELDVENLRLAQQMLSCILARAGSPCGKEAEFAVKFVLSPFEDVLDQKCLELTQKKCNGATNQTSASGLMCGSWLLLLSAMFLLIRYFE